MVNSSLGHDAPPIVGQKHVQVVQAKDEKVEMHAEVLDLG